VSGNDGVTVRIDGNDAIINAYIPVLTFSDDLVCLFDFLFAPTHYIVGLQIKISPDSLNTECGCVNFVCIY